MSTNVEIETSLRGSLGVIRLSGDITLSAEKPIMQAYEQLTKESCSKILLKFSHSCYINSGGIAVLITLTDTARKKKQKVGFCELSKRLKDIFETIGLTAYITLYATEEEAFKGK